MRSLSTMLRADSWCCREIPFEQEVKIVLSQSVLALGTHGSLWFSRGNSMGLIMQAWDAATGRWTLFNLPPEIECVNWSLMGMKEVGVQCLKCQVGSPSSHLIFICPVRLMLILCCFPVIWSVERDERLEELLTVSNSSFCCYPGELVTRTGRRTVWGVSAVSSFVLALQLSFAKTCDCGVVLSWC